ncbi:hypothetical protein [Hyphococcus sp.]|uniref:hypothetical protein n=1 Tax=Hyphococcus sp. TaxID=2038636 RepID=UPI003D1375FD
MRIFVFIALIFSMAVSPAVALASCASMGGEAGMMEMADAGPQMSMGAMGADDCDSMKGEKTQSHDAGCAAACALICPGFYSGPEPTAENGLAFHLVQYAIPPAEPGLATPSHLDPPPPRI